MDTLWSNYASGILYSALAISPDNSIFNAYCDNLKSGQLTVKKFNAGSSNWDDLVTKGFVTGNSTSMNLIVNPVSGDPYINYNGNLYRFSNGSWAQAAVQLGFSISFPKFTGNGTIYAASLNSNQTQIKKYSNNIWTNVGTALAFPAYDISVTENGDVYVWGSSTLKKYIAGVWADVNTNTQEIPYSAPIDGANNEVFGVIFTSSAFYLKNYSTNQHYYIGQSNTPQLRMDRNKIPYIFHAPTYGTTVAVSKLLNGSLQAISTLTLPGTMQNANIFFDSSNSLYASTLTYDQTYKAEVRKLVSNVWTKVGSTINTKPTENSIFKADISTSNNIFGAYYTNDGVFAKVFGTYSTLPILLANYEARKSAQNVRLSWSTSRKTSDGCFLIEKSLNKEVFKEIGRVQAQNNALGSSYYLTDFAPENGINYYRLTQLDNDGTKTILGVKVVEFSFTGKPGYIYPNPILTSTFYVKLNNQKKKYRVRITDILGKIVFDESVNVADERLVIDTGSKLASGTYLVAIEGEASFPVIVQ